MDRSQEKTTVPYPPVGADGGQSLSQKSNQSIAEEQAEHKPHERDFREILRQIDRVNDPAYLPSLSMNELYEKVYPGKPPWWRAYSIRGCTSLWALPRSASPFSWRNWPIM